MSVVITANGKQINVDHIRLKQEDTLAVGNMNVNARGDVVGEGGKIVKTRQQVMQEYYSLHTPVPKDTTLPKDGIEEDFE